MLVGFADAEGQGDKGEDYEAKLMTSVLMVSRVNIFNWHGKTQKSSILKRVGALAHARKQLRLSPQSSASAAGAGGSAGRPWRARRSACRSARMLFMSRYLRGGVKITETFARSSLRAQALRRSSGQRAALFWQGCKSCGRAFSRPAARMARPHTLSRLSRSPI